MLPLMTVGMGVDVTNLALEQRLQAIPQTAAVRGVFFNLVRHALARRGLHGALRHEPALAQTHRSYKLYSAREWVAAFAHAGALLHSDPLEGMALIFGDAPRYYASTWYGQMLRTLLQPDPLPALRWIERSREHLCNYGYWRLETRGPTHVVLHMFDEYMWTEAHRGGCEGLLAACGVQGSVRASQDTLLQGRLEIEWVKDRPPEPAKNWSRSA
jgi:uncharacterized protein (TIGR02265 family)